MLTGWTCTYGMLLMHPVGCWSTAFIPFIYKSCIMCPLLWHGKLLGWLNTLQTSGSKNLELTGCWWRVGSSYSSHIIELKSSVVLASACQIWFELSHPIFKSLLLYFSTGSFSLSNVTKKKINLNCIYFCALHWYSLGGGEFLVPLTISAPSLDWCNISFPAS